MKNMKSLAVGLILAVTTLDVTVAKAFSAPIRVPTVLNAGDQYRLVFVTSTFRDATSTDVTDYDELVTVVANS